MVSNNLPPTLKNMYNNWILGLQIQQPSTSRYIFHQVPNLSWNWVVYLAGLHIFHSAGKNIALNHEPAMISSFSGFSYFRTVISSL